MSTDEERSNNPDVAESLRLFDLIVSYTREPLLQQLAVAEGKLAKVRERIEDPVYIFDVYDDVCIRTRDLLAVLGPVAGEQP